MGGDHLAGIQFGEQVFNQGRLARSDSTSDDDKTLTLAQAVAQVRERTAVDAAAKEKSGDRD
ncbi:hypothetical protein [Candidatus Competibacter phosphatis]|uniref:hypothetical protein n=1 Tax=Candidatus Competibacter phosphatis TaxID=221280 RepID=UPI001FE3BA27|nr:hypothetical protein [Candidatus Competibacter phosphatis]